MASDSTSSNEPNFEMRRSHQNQSTKFGSIQIAGHFNSSVIQTGDVEVRNVGQVGTDSVFQVTSAASESFDQVETAIAALADQMNNPAQAIDLRDAVHEFYQEISSPATNEPKLYFLLSAIGELSLPALELLVQWLTRQQPLSPSLEEFARRALRSTRRSTKK